MKERVFEDDFSRLMLLERSRQRKREWGGTVKERWSEETR